MTDYDRNSTASRLQADALAWVRRLNSGGATAADMHLVEQWRGTSPLHAEAFARAVLLWKVLGEAAQYAEHPRRVSHAGETDAGQVRTIGRRAVLTGGAALAASLAGAVVVHPPLGLWPSLSELTADYRTRTGERREVKVAGYASLEMNTRTSVDVRPPSDGASSPRIELLTGEATIVARVEAADPLLVVAGSGHARARRGAFNIRKDDDRMVTVTCVHGQVEVACTAGEATLRDGQQVAYNERRFSEVGAIDPDIVTAWRQGLLIFRQQSLAHVIDEVNRYRSGRIVLLDGKLGQRLIVATFRLDRIDEVVAFMAKAMGLPVRNLPGGLTLVG